MAVPLSITDEEVVNYFEALSQNLPGEIQKSHEKLNYDG
jgi:hypothetical protein